MLSRSERINDEQLIHQLLERAGEDPSREGLVETPRRFLAAWDFLTSGYGQDPKAILKTFNETQNYDQLVFQGAIPLHSMCEHHLVTFFGVAHIGYVPNGAVVGLSKLARLTDIFARRLTMQERITVQIADAIMEHLRAKGVGVVLQCRHLCMEARGIQKVGTITMTSALRGCVKKEADCRSEFMSLVTTAASGLTRP